MCVQRKLKAKPHEPISKQKIHSEPEENIEKNGIFWQLFYNIRHIKQTNSAIADKERVAVVLDLV